MVELKTGKDAVILATGGLVGSAMQAAAELEKEGMSVGVVNVHTIKPIDTETIAKWCGRVKHLFTAEDHNIIGGLGGAVAEVMASLGTTTKLTRIGVHDTYGESGTPEGLYIKHGLDGHGVARTVKSTLKS